MPHRTQWKTIVHFHYCPKSLKNEVLKSDPQIILGFFDPDPVLLAKLFNPLLCPPAMQGAQDQDQKIPE